MIPQKFQKKIVALGLEEFTDIEISAAEIAALNATPKVLVGPPVATQFYIFTGMIVHKPANNSAFTIGANDDLTVRFTGVAGTQLATIETTGLLNATTEQLRYVFPWAAASGNSAITLVSGALVLHALNASPAGGGDGILHWRVFFKRSAIAVGAGL